MDTLVAQFLVGPSNTASVDAIGGNRTLEIVAPRADITSLQVTGAGTLSHGQTTNGGGMSTATWDDNTSGLGGVDLTDGGFDIGLRVEILSIDVNAVTLQFMITDTLAQVSTLTLPGLTVGSNDVLFTGFTGSANFTIVDKIVFKITAETDSDLEIDFIETLKEVQIAEPPVLVMTVGLAGGMLLLRRRR